MVYDNGITLRSPPRRDTKKRRCSGHRPSNRNDLTPGQADRLAYLSYQDRLVACAAITAWYGNQATLCRGSLGTIRTDYDWMI